MGRMQRAGGIVVAAVLGLGLVACGGGDDDEAVDTTTTEDGGGSDSGTTDVDLSDFTGECAAFAEAFAGAGTAIGSAFSGTGGDDLEQVADYFSEVADRLPDEISDDFEVFAAAYSDFASAMAEADIDFSDPSSVDPDKLSELESISEAFSSAEVQEASANIEAYISANCNGG